MSPTPIASQFANRILAAALKIGDCVFTAPPPARHHTLLHALYAVAPDRIVQPVEQGFMDVHASFVDRREAWTIAEAADQIIPRQHQRAGYLFSEDLW